VNLPTKWQGYLLEKIKARGVLNNKKRTIMGIEHDGPIPLPPILVLLQNNVVNGRRVAVTGR